MNNVKNQGFTLVEIAMVTVIFSLMMNLFGYGLLAYQKKQKYDETKRRLTVIEKALDEFLEINGRLPCVARLDRRPGQAGFGVEVFSIGPSGERACRWALPGALPSYEQTNPPVGGISLSWNRMGSVPVRSLNLPDEYLLDAWGSRFTYIISERQASESAPGESMYRENSGSINVVDSQGNSVIDQVNQRYPGFDNFAEYVLISHGEDKKGGRSLSNGNVELVPCPALGTELQSENCIYTAPNHKITVSGIISDGNYDDIVRYKAGTNRNEILPSGAVVGFDQAVGAGGLPPANFPAPVGGFLCPIGWRAFEDARGRFIMGASAIGTSIQRTERSNSITLTPSGASRTYTNLGQRENDMLINTPTENAAVTVPPFVTILFCEKQ